MARVRRRAPPRGGRRKCRRSYMLGFASIANHLTTFTEDLSLPKLDGDRNEESLLSLLRRFRKLDVIELKLADAPARARPRKFCLDLCTRALAPAQEGNPRRRSDGRELTRRAQGCMAIVVRGSCGVGWSCDPFDDACGKFTQDNLPHQLFKMNVHCLVCRTQRARSRCEGEVIARCIRQ